MKNYKIELPTDRQICREGWSKLKLGYSKKTAIYTYGLFIGTIKRSDSNIRSYMSVIKWMDSPEDNITIYCGRCLNFREFKYITKELLAI